MGKDQIQLSPQAQAIESLFENIQRAQEKIVGAENDWVLARNLIQNDLEAARLAAKELTGAERSYMLGFTYYLEGQITYTCMTSKMGGGRTSLEDAARHAEKAISYAHAAYFYTLLGRINWDLGEYDKAKAAFEKGAALPSDTGKGEAQRELLRLQSHILKGYKKVEDSRRRGIKRIKSCSIAAATSFLLSIVFMIPTSAFIFQAKYTFEEILNGSLFRYLLCGAIIGFLIGLIEYFIFSKFSRSVKTGPRWLLQSDADSFSKKGLSKIKLYSMVTIGCYALDAIKASGHSGFYFVQQHFRYMLHGGVFVQVFCFSFMGIALGIFESYIIVPIRKLFLS